MGGGGVIRCSRCIRAARKGGESASENVFLDIKKLKLIDDTDLRRMTYFWPFQKTVAMLEDEIATPQDHFCVHVKRRKGGGSSDAADASEQRGRAGGLRPKMCFLIPRN